MLSSEKGGLAAGGRMAGIEGFGGTQLGKAHLEKSKWDLWKQGNTAGPGKRPGQTEGMKRRRWDHHFVGKGWRAGEKLEPAKEGTIGALWEEEIIKLRERCGPDSVTYKQAGKRGEEKEKKTNKKNKTPKQRVSKQAVGKG